MKHDPELDLVAALNDATRELNRASREDWRLSSGEPATGRLAGLSDQLENALRRVQAGEKLPQKEFDGMVRWLTDWIPNLDDPLVTAISKVERAAAAGG